MFSAGGLIASAAEVVVAVAGLAAVAGPVDAAPAEWNGPAPRSVLVQPVPSPVQAASRKRQPTGTAVPALPEAFESGQFETVPGGTVVGDSSFGDGSIAEPSIAGEGSYEGDPAERGAGEYDGLIAPGTLQPTASGLPESEISECRPCGGNECMDPAWRYNALCEPAGLFQKLWCLGKNCGDDGSWTGRIDALILWRNAPPGRPLVDGPVGTVLNANQLDSTAASGPRASIFYTDKCTGNSWESTYLRAANFRSQRLLPAAGGPYVVSAPGIYGNGNTANFDSGSANLGSSLQSFEFNRHVCHGQHLRWLAGFRWAQWNEQFTLQDSFGSGGTDFYQTGCVNDMYGGQIGLDAYLLSLPWLRVDSVIKAGAYYNTAVQNSLYTTSDPPPGINQSVSVGQTPASCAFIGELGFTGIMPITDNLDFRFGYFGLWLSGIAQPTQQLSGQTLNESQAIGSLNTLGGVIVQGVSLGLEGRW